MLLSVAEICSGNGRIPCRDCGGRDAGGTHPQGRQRAASAGRGGGVPQGALEGARWGERARAAGRAGIAAPRLPLGAADGYSSWDCKRRVRVRLFARIHERDVMGTPPHATHTQDIHPALPCLPRMYTPPVGPARGRGPLHRRVRQEAARRRRRQLGRLVARRRCRRAAQPPAHVPGGGVCHRRDRARARRGGVPGSGRQGAGPADRDAAAAADDVSV